MPDLDTVFAHFYGKRGGPPLKRVHPGSKYPVEGETSTNHHFSFHLFLGLYMSLVMTDSDMPRYEIGNEVVLST